MNDFFMHQALQKNSDSVAQLNIHLEDLKRLTNGDLAKEASKELSETRELFISLFTSEIIKIQGSFNGMVTSVRAEQNENFERYRSFLKLSMLLLSCMLAINIGVLCFVVLRAH